jgi:hypothetical protein
MSRSLVGSAQPNRGCGIDAVSCAAPLFLEWNLARPSQADTDHHHHFRIDRPSLTYDLRKPKLTKLTGLAEEEEAHRLVTDKPSLQEKWLNA